MAMSTTAAFVGLPDAILTHNDSWQAWYDAELPEALEIPVLGAQLSSFQRLCVIKVQR